jgi:hypothetical protein
MQIQIWFAAVMPSFHWSSKPIMIMKGEGSWRKTTNIEIYMVLILPAVRFLLAGLVAPFLWV